MDSNETHEGRDTMTTYYTKDQAESVLKAWGRQDPLPRKGMMLGIQWVSGMQPNHCTITVHSQPSTYGKKLYKFVFENR